MDRRQKKTRRAVFDAFTKLLTKKNYANITVQEIIDEADIGRSTFYSHFETKDELLKELCREILDHVFDDEHLKRCTYCARSDCDKFEKIADHILFHIGESRAYIKSLLSSESGELFMRFFKEDLREQFSRIITFEDVDIPLDFRLNHIVCEFAETVRWWMKNDSITPNEISRYYMRVCSLKQG